MNYGEYFGQTVVITGGARGIGACTGDAFCQAGAKVILGDTDVKAARLREKELNRRYGEGSAFFIKADMGDPKQVKKFAGVILAKHKQVRVLMNNTGIGYWGDLLQRPRWQWDKVIAVNLTSYYLCAQLLTPALARTRGAIVNIASTRALMSEPNSEPYAASKGGILSLTHALALSLSKHHIRVNSICPGWIATGEWQIPAQPIKLRKIDHEQHPAGRVGRPEDIARAVLFLASNDSAGFITGQNLVVDGGMTAKMIYVE